MIAGKHLGASALDALAAEERAQRATETRHLATCSRCRDDLSRLREVLQVLTRRGASHRARRPLGAALRAVREVVPVPPLAARKLEEHDPGAMTAAPVGLRAGEASRQWLFAAGSLEVDVQAFAEGPESLTLLGQIAEPAAEADLAVHLHHDGDAVLTLPDAMGRFAMHGVHGDAVELVIESSTGMYSIELGRLPAPPRDAEPEDRPVEDEPEAGS